MTHKNQDNKKFHENRDKRTFDSAWIVAECFFEHSGGYEVHSAIDLGCGVGTFLKVLKQRDKNITVCGVDGDYIQRDMLVIAPDEFQPWDLKKPYVTDKQTKYDLAISMEVAEHLPPERAKSFVEDLTSLADVVLFSAALPYQGGVGHINEQLLSYWAALFEEQGYELRDIIRPDSWNRKEVLVWYRSNMVVFVRKDSPAAQRIDKKAYKQLIDVINPDMYMGKMIKTAGRLGRIYFKIEDILARIRAVFR